MSTFSDDDAPSDPISVDTIGETCIGDILSKDGYNLSFFGGSQFTAKEKITLFKNQGFKTIILETDLDKAYLDSDPKSNWGYHDKTTLNAAADHLDTLQHGATPHGTLILTLDTHPPGLASPSCATGAYADGSDALLNSVHCSDRLLAEFISTLLDKPDLQNLTIFLISDHLQSGKIAALDELDRNDREYLFAVFNSRVERQDNHKSTREFTPLDGAPTILGYLGYDIKTLNLGRNALRDDAPTLVEQLGKTVLTENVVPIRHKLHKYWQEQRQGTVGSSPNH